MTIQQFIDEVKQAYAKQFPDSLCHIQFDNKLYSSIGISCTMAKDITECAHNIWMNDPVSFRLSIDHNGKAFSKDFTKESELPDDLLITVWANNYKIKPENKYLCYSSNKINARKTSGNAKKLITTIEKWFKQLKVQLQDDINNGIIHPDHEKLFNAKVF